MLASSPTMRISGSEYTSGMSSMMSSAIPGPTDVTSVSVVNAPPEVLKYSMNTSESVVIERTSIMAPKLPRSPGRGNAPISHSLFSVPQVSTQLTNAPRLLLPALLLGLASSAAAAQGTPAISVIPYPAAVTVDSSVSFVLGPRATIRLTSLGDPELRRLGRVTSEMLRDEIGVQAIVSPTAATPLAVNGIVLALVPRDTAAGLESYRLDVTASGVKITAPRHAGLFFGIQTLRGLVQAERGRHDTGRSSDDSVRATQSPLRLGRVVLVGTRIEDAPRFPYRGMHLDVARHFAPVSFVKRYHRPDVAVQVQHLPLASHR